MNRTKVTGLLFIVCITVALIGISSPTASAAMLGSWTPSMKAVITATSTQRVFSSLIEAVAKFEGTLQAYSVSNDPRLEEQVLLASNDIGKSLESFNTDLKEIYPDLTKEQQEAFKDAYLSLGSYLEKLAEEANQIFNGEDGKAKATFEVQEIGEIAPNLPNQFWVGSAVAV